MPKRSKVELYEQIRKARQREPSVSIRELARRFHVHRRDVRQALSSALPPPRRMPSRPAPVLGPWKGVIDGWLEADQSAPREQRHTARRVWQRLVEEHGVEVGEVHRAPLRGRRVRSRHRSDRRALQDRGHARRFPAEIETAAMTRLRKEAHTRMLGNGLCTRPVELECRIESACETCAYFETGSEFVSVLLRQRDHARKHGQTERAVLFDGLLSRVAGSGA